MSTDTIVVEIDDTQLDAVLAKLHAIALQATVTITGATGGRKKPLASALPSIDRDLRVILSRIPGMRQAIQLLYRVRRVERGVLREAAGYGTWSLYLAILATAIIALRGILSLHKQYERYRKRQEMLVARERRLSREEAKALMKEWKNYVRRMPG